MMGFGIQFRLALFGLVILLAAVGVGWVAHNTRQQFEELSERLTRVQIESFQTADEFRARLQELDVILLRWGIHRHPEDRQQFEVLSKELDKWIDDQMPRLTTEKERRIFDQINVTYDAYLAAATNLLATTGWSASDSKAFLAAFEKVDRDSKTLLDLGFQLVEAHRDSMSQFLTGSRKSLISFRSLFFAGYGILLGLGGWATVVAYRGLISPLKVKLLESHALLERQEKLASLGVLAAGVAHEIRNPLTAIKARLFTLQRSLRADSAEKEDLEVIGREIVRLERIVKDFLLFAKPSEPQWTEVNAADPLRQVHTLLAPQLKKSNIMLVLEEPPVVRVRIDPQQIEQVLINLVQNGADAIGRNGTVTLRTRLETKRLRDGPKEVVIFEVADTGKGIPPEVQKRLFDPFFSTKEAGTGLGLPIAARILQKHGGSLQYQTQVDHGTTFGIVLPRMKDDRS